MIDNVLLAAGMTSDLTCWLAEREHAQCAVPGPAIKSDHNAGALATVRVGR